MKLLARIQETAEINADRIAFKNVFLKESITYGELNDKSNRVANYISRAGGKRGTPVIVYGHKKSDMLICFLGCVKSGHPYCPVDISTPIDRVKDIVDISKTDLFIETEPIEIDVPHKICEDELRNIYAKESGILDETLHVENDETFYIIFTSGSTGKPKGVQISANCLDNFLVWMEHIGNGNYFENSNSIFLNQAPYSFDLSVMDVYTSLFVRGTIWALDKRMNESMAEMFEAFEKSQISIWVSTPSFVNMCLVNKKFNQKLLPKLTLFLFCGETLTNHTAEVLKERFPNAVIINTYGPTETTVAVTEVIVDDKLITSSKNLPIGRPKPGTDIFIMDDEGNIISENCSRGEIVIAGNTVTTGYLNQPQLSSEKFITLDIENRKLRAYKTGDEGYFDKDLLFYCGRKDFQLKVNGYRIELGDIESNILSIENILYCVVLPIVKKEENKGLIAFVVTKSYVENEFAYAQELRNKLSSKIPKYMIPKKFIFLKSMPMTTNGKCDRRQLEQMI